MTETTEVMWKTKHGEIPLSEVSNLYLQNILRYCEFRYMLYNNIAVTQSLRAEQLEQKRDVTGLETRALQACRKSEIYHKLIKAVKQEGITRGVQLQSLGDKNKNKYQILRNLHKVI